MGWALSASPRLCALRCTNDRRVIQSWQRMSDIDGSEAADLIARHDDCDEIFVDFVSDQNTENVVADHEMTLQILSLRGRAGKLEIWSHLRF